MLLLGLLSLVTPLGLAGWLAGVCYAVAVCGTLVYALHKAGGSLGPADHVTLSRATLVGCVTALVADNHAPVPLLVTLASVALVMDAIDGQIARRTGTASPLGARFDMEVDAFLILVLSIHVASSLGLWVLAIGAMRYLFVVASWWLAWLRGSLPPSIARKTVAAIQGIVLVVAASEVFPRWFSITVTGLALASLVWSFARDVRWLRKQGIFPA
ncbi:MAG: CDP-alcohol phosphatidyltransferase family protein [Kibdelosporangium sp.]